MQISILHLSDIHFKIGHNIILNRKEKLYEAIKNEIRGKDAVFIVTSGDIAFSGQKEEYSIALKFYLDLYDSIKAYTELEVKFIFIPGNHDCSFNNENEIIRKLLIEKFSKEGFNDLNESLIDTCCRPQENYFEFINKINSLTEGTSQFPDYGLNHRLLSIITFDIQGKILKFNLYNTSWISALPERIGTLKYPLEYISGKIPQIESQCSISLLHHPLNWHTPEYSKPILDFLIRTSDVIISGHEHLSSAGKRTDLHDNYDTIVIESSALQESEKLNSSYNLLNLNLANNELQILKYDYDEQNNHKNYILKNDSGWIQILKDKKLKSKDYQLKEVFKKSLEDVGAKYSHSTAETISVKDLFVIPFLQSMDIDIDKIKPRLVQFQLSDIVLNINEDKEVCLLKILLGADSSGKTTMLKYYYLKYYELGYYPIFLTVSNFNSVEIEKLKKIIQKEFSNQYDELDAQYESIDYSKIVILIDDFHNFNNQKAKVILLRHLTKLFTKIIITGNELLRFESFKDKDDKTIDPYENFNWHLIKEFNPSLRNQLITKWYRLGRDYMDLTERNDFFRKIDHATENIDNIVGRNFVPAFPIYILAILQGLETGESSTSSNKQHAYYYELLITNSLKRALKDKEEIGFYMTLCKEYFYFLFKEKIRFKSISYESFNTFFNNHKEVYRISRLNNDGVLEILIKSRILKKDITGNISIAYKYLYYYFVAKYMADNLEDEVIKTEIELMADRVYRDEYSNIIIFLIHLARNNFVIDKLIEKSKSIYTDYEAIRLDNDINLINKLQSEVPDAVLIPIEIDEARRNDLKNEDEYEEIEMENSEESLNESYELNEDISQNYLAILTKAVRTIDILGQLTKKYWGELKGNDKYDLAEETFMLGLRTLKYQFTLIDSNVDGLIQHIKKILLKKYRLEDLSTSNVEASSGNFLFSLCVTSTFGVLKRIVNAIGTEKLTDIYNEIESKHPYNSISLTNVGIKLEHFNTLPITDLENFRDNNNSNLLALVVMRKFLIDYMYMYDLEYAQRQKICDNFGIRMEEQRFISGYSPIKKTN